MDPQSIPAALRDIDQWLCWQEQERDGKATKVPVDARTGEFASVTDASTWSDFETAHAGVTTLDASGVGFVFTEADSFVGVDLDDCRDAETGRPDGWAKEIVQSLDSYTEVSPSGTGYHVYVCGNLPAGRNRSGHVELYESARFFTVTGAHVDGTPAVVNERNQALRQVHAEYVADGSPSGSGSHPADTDGATGHDLSDEELLTRARNAKNAPKFERLWRGDTSGYDSHSEADMALCFLLAFWTGGDVAAVDRLFRHSGLYREKWDEPHYADGRTYGAVTAERAVRETSEVYEPREQEEVETPREDRSPTEAAASSLKSESRSDVESLRSVC
ncbi:hypothetical protein [Halospeciosus flavus]|uniref:phage NrS-1 polymerase family protein n=1 Tax=Halospeciosus flavus TaxID=3032283 RepID=UPI003623370C